MINFLTLFFPRRCAICDRVVEKEMMICADCEKKIRFNEAETCMICGKELKEGGELCGDCKKTQHYFIRNFAVFPYDQLRMSLYRFKYAGRCEYARYYAFETERLYGEVIRTLNADAIVPVPLHKTRYRKRGYNQAEIFGRELSERLKIPLNTKLIKRCKKTKAMKLLSRSERQNNLKKAFIIGENDVKLKTIIVVDDIFTTGTTLDCIAQECRAAGIQNIYTITIAIGHGN